MTDDILDMDDLMKASKKHLAQTVQGQANLMDLLNRELAEKELELAEAKARYAGYENAVTWEVSCLGCAGHLDTQYALHMAEEELGIRRAQWSEVIRYMAHPPEAAVHTHFGRIAEIMISDPREGTNGRAERDVAPGADSAPPAL